MAELNCQIVRPDRSLYEGAVANLVLVTYAGELGVWPGHAPEVVALGDGVVRIRRTPEDGGGEFDVVVSGGYAEIDREGVIILADHARRTDDIDVETVRRTREKALDLLDEMEDGDYRAAYYEKKVRWCNLLLKQATGDPAPSTR
ncbi:ATP synthase F1 subunit epsilon [Thermophilibacter provencensis]|uniref:ATP synthase epsilon chain n=1 Tax=Thermophilibacter provencensis TaxID=1852386 RepID=A0ABT7V2A6_9ACTN|nr:ATP synthase F1 subunit epsilon [Thermophilibacter provencensis]MDM8270734.1 ATP synthase F1 subunit epsilon [Thermophilibacter provencensis]